MFVTFSERCSDFSNYLIPFIINVRMSNSRNFVIWSVLSTNHQIILGITKGKSEKTKSGYLFHQNTNEIQENKKLYQYPGEIQLF